MKSKRDERKEKARIKINKDKCEKVHINVKGTRNKDVRKNPDR